MRIKARELDSLLTHSALVAIRHGQDCKRLTPFLDEPLTKDGFDDVEDLGREINDLICGIKGELREVQIYHSPKIRAAQTATVIERWLFGRLIRVKVIPDPNLRELYQGVFTVQNHIEGEAYPPLVDAWNAWQERWWASDLLYRFGDPLFNDSGIPSYPGLVGKFTQFGDNQREFSLRIYSFLASIMRHSYSGLRMVVAHQATLSRMQRILSVIRSISETQSLQPGELVSRFEKLGARHSLGYGEAVIVEMPSRLRAVELLDSEVRYLQILRHGKFQ